MAKTVLVCYRDARRAPAIEASVRCALQRLTPDNLRAPQHEVYSASGLCLGVLSPAAGVRLRGTSVLLGDALTSEDWHEPGREAPDGSYALFRTSETHVELVADLCASRTIWYLLTDDALVASTSQRAIVTVMGSFSSNRSALSWFLSAGTLGCEDAWDTRLRRVHPGERIRLDRTAWSTRSSVEMPAPDSLPPEMPAREAAIAEAFTRAFAHRDWSSPPWVLTLSGGADSRAILLHLKDPSSMSCVTWGAARSLDHPHGDGAVASRLARAVGAPHRLLEIDETTPFDEVLPRFLANSEARTDNMAGYLDGFALWAGLAAEGTQGIIRGDTLFTGWGFDDTLPSYPKLDPLRPREEWLRLPASRGFGRGWKILAFADYDDRRLRDLAAEFPSQRWPDSLLLAAGEKESDWRGRCFREYQYPVKLAALNDAKAAYVEVANPLLSRDLVNCVLAMADPPLASTKTPFANAVQSLMPEMPFASRASIAHQGDWMQRADVREAVRDTLSDTSLSGLLPAPVIDLALRHTDARRALGARSQGLRRGVKDVLLHAATPALRARAGRRVPAHLRTYALGLRCLLACHMDALLRADAAAGRQSSLDA